MVFQEVKRPLQAPVSKVSLPGGSSLPASETQDSVLSKSSQELPVHGEEFFSQSVPSLS